MMDYYSTPCTSDLNYANLQTGHLRPKGPRKKHLKTLEWVDKNKVWKKQIIIKVFMLAQINIFSKTALHAINNKTLHSEIGKYYNTWLALLVSNTL